MQKSFVKEFKLYCKKKNLDVNSHQIKLIKTLEEYYKLNYKSFISKILSKKNYKKGFYLYGDVGVGKTMILDFFFNLVEGKKLKLHFNEFMLSFHDFVHQSKDKNDENKLSKFVKKLKSKAKLIYFDEFQVTNIVDAMILGKLFDEIFKEDLKIIVTSNIKIENLYKDGLQRDQFKPFIKIMQNQSFEYQLNIDDDYRKSKGNKTQRYYSPLNQENNFKINKLFRVMTKDKVLKEKILNIKGRKFILKNFYDGIVRLTFKEVCDKNLGSEDYIKIVKNCFFIVMENVPAFNDLNSNQQQRFITFLDIVYDQNIPMAISAEQNIDKLTSSRLLEKPFKRTISRLYELTSKKYLWDKNFLILNLKQMVKNYMNLQIKR